MLTLDVAAKARAKKAAPSVSRCGSWHGSASTCPCNVDRTAAPEATSSAEPSWDAPRGTAAPGSVGDVVRGHGRPLEEQTRREMQQRLGHDFGAVQVHAGPQAAASARAVQALAYTVGEHVVLDEQRMPSAPSERSAVLAHELVHTIQQGPLDGRRMPDRVSEPGESHEREAHRAAGSTDRAGAGAGTAAGTVSRAPTPELESPPGVSISIREDGRLDVVARGPKAPVIGKPAAGLRRNVDGSYTVVFGADEKVVSPAEIPPMLRSAVGGAEKGGSAAAPQSFRIPTCASLRSIDGTRWRTYDEYRVSQMLSPGLMPLTPLFYQQLIDRCTAERAPVEAPPAVPDVAPKAEPHEALPPVSPEGEAVV